MMRRVLTLLIAVVCLLPLGELTAQSSPPCLFNLRNPFVGPDVCAEVIFEGPLAGDMDAIGALAFGPDGALYFTQPAARQITRLPARGDGTFGPPEVFAGNLPEAPLGLTYHTDQGVWFASTDRMILRITAAGEVRAIVDDLPGGAGGWLSNLRIGPDGDLYAVKGLRCPTCTDPDPRRGGLLRIGPDGSRIEVIAAGFRDVFDLAWGPGNALYIPDQPDTLRALICPPNLPCTEASQPAVIFPAGSAPRSALIYRGAAFPAWQGNLLVGLAGSWNGTTLSGFEVVALTLDGQGGVTATERILPDYFNLPSATLSLIRASYYPYRVGSLAVDSAGWLYTAVSEGRIYRFRPRSP